MTQKVELWWYSIFIIQQWNKFLAGDHELIMQRSNGVWDLNSIYCTKFDFPMNINVNQLTCGRESIVREQKKCYVTYTLSHKQSITIKVKALLRYIPSVPVLMEATMNGFTKLVSSVNISSEILD